MAKRKNDLGRVMIETIKDAYENGQTFWDVFAIREYLIATTGVKPARVRTQAVSAWDRQARYERADAKHSVTSPGAANRYVRIPDPEHRERLSSRVPRYQDIETRAANLVRLASADAAQVDASRYEIEVAIRMQVAEEVLRGIRETGTKGI